MREESEFEEVVTGVGDFAGVIGRGLLAGLAGAAAMWDFPED